MKPIHTTNLSSMKQQGFSVLEVLVASTIGVLVLGSAISLQVANRGEFQATTSELEMKTNSKMAAEFIANSIRAIGAMGCRTTDGYYGVKTGESSDKGNKSQYKISLNDRMLAHANFNRGHEVLGYQAVGTGWVPTPDLTLGMTGMVEGSDAITLRGAIGESYVLQDRLPGDASYNLAIPAGTDVLLTTNNFAVASTCKSAEVFKVTSGDAAIDSGTIGRAVGGGADENSVGTWTAQDGIDRQGFGELRRVATISYYIADNPAGIPTLYRNIDGGTSSPLVEGVERMKIDYGIEDNSNSGERNVANRYLSASAIQATCPTPVPEEVPTACLWPNVVSVRVSFIMRSREQVFGKNVSQTYTLPGTDQLDYATNDRFSRALYSSTIVIRNRLIGDRTDEG